MILSHKYKFIFIHIGKTGGTSIEYSLSEALNLSLDDTQYNKEIINNVNKVGGPIPLWATQKDHTGRINCKHINARQLKQIIGNRIWNEYFKFSFVRNPYDSLLSEFSMFTQFEAFKNHPWNKYVTFGDFCRAIITGDQRISRNPYHGYLSDDKEDLSFDFVGKFESLQADYYKICDKIGLPKIKLPHISPTVHKPFSEYYTPEATEMIYNIRKKDFQSFGYSRKINNTEHLSLMKKIYIIIRFYQFYAAPAAARKLKTAVLR